jgi:hypothetical protein
MKQKIQSVASRQILHSAKIDRVEREHASVMKLSRLHFIPSGVSFSNRIEALMLSALLWISKT